MCLYIQVVGAIAPPNGHILLNKFHTKINELNRQNAPSPLIRFAIGALFFCLSETIPFDNVQQIGELITLKTLRGFLAFSRQSFEKLYIAYIKDLNRHN